MRGVAFLEPPVARPLMTRRVAVALTVAAGLIAGGSIILHVLAPAIVDGRFVPRMMTSTASIAIVLALLGQHGVVRIPSVAGRVLLAFPVLVAAVSMSHVFTDGSRARVLGSGVSGLWGHGMPFLVAFAVCVLVIGVHGLRAPARWVLVTDLCGYVAFAIGLLISLAYGVGAPGDTFLGDPNVPTQGSGVLLLLLSVGLLGANLDRGGVFAIFGSPTVGGLSARIFAPFALAVPILLEILRGRAVSVPGMDADLVATLTVFALTIAITTLVIAGARRLDRYDRALRLARETSFMSALAHDLRTPLIAIRNLADIVDKRWEDIAEEQRRHVLRTTSEEATRLLRMVHDASQRAKLEAGVLAAQPRAVLLRDVIIEAVAEQGAAVEVRCPHDVVASVDPEHLRMMIRACLSHAIDTRAGATTIAVEGTPDEVCIDVDIPSAAAGDDATDPTPFGADLCAVARLARLSGGDALYQRVGDDAARLVIRLVPASLSERPGRAG